MSSEPPKPGSIPGWGQQSGEQPTPAAPGPSAPGGGAIPGWGQQPAAGQPATPAPSQAGGAIPGWGQQPSAPAPTTEQPPSAAPVVPDAPPPAAPAAPGGWGATPSASPPAAPSSAGQPGWGQTPSAPPPAAPPPGGGQPGWGSPPGTPAAPGGTAAPGGQPPGTWNPQPAQASGASGCLKIVLILVVIGAIGFFLLIAGLIFLGNRLADSVGVNGDGSAGDACTIIDNASLRDVIGGDAEALELNGLFDATLGLVLDKRVLPDAEDCFISSNADTTPTGRIARYQGSDAGARYQQERTKAAPTSQDQGGGITLEDSGYFAGEVSGLGDEAFCTGVSAAIQAGVLVRKGDTLVYVSLSGPADGSTPEFVPTGDGVISAPSICAQAQEIARKILR